MHSLSGTGLFSWALRKWVCHTWLWRIPFSDPSRLNVPKSQKALLQLTVDGHECRGRGEGRGEFRWAQEVVPVPHHSLRPHLV